MLEMATLKGWNLLMAAKDVTSTRVWGFLEEPQPRCHRHHRRPPRTHRASGATCGARVPVPIAPYLAESRVPRVQ